MTLLNNILEIALDVAPWLLAGLTVAGLIKGWIPERKMAVWLGGSGVGSIARGAVIGAPLPLCSCGAVPAGIALHRGGASRGATTAFMVGAPGIGVDSIALTYALMGPFMAVARAMSAVASAVAVGLFIAVTPSRNFRSISATRTAATRTGCCEDDSCQTQAASVGESELPFARRAVEGLRYAVSDVLKDIGPWMVLGIVLAGVLATLISPEALAEQGSGWAAMMIMAVIGIPLYLCAQAATPIAAGMILAGISPGTALVFLLAAPITSLATLAVLRREFGMIPVMVFVAAVAGSSIAAGVAVDALTSGFAVNIIAQVGETKDVFPRPVQYLALAILIFFMVFPARREMMEKLKRRPTI